MKIINIIQTGRSLEKDENQCLLVYACETLVKVQLNNSKQYINVPLVPFMAFSEQHSFMNLWIYAEKLKD